jgi:GAF domain-containing protein
VPPSFDLSRAAAELEAIDMSAVLDGICAIVVRALPFASEASATLLHDGRPSTVAYTGLTALALDMRQYSSWDGPCLDAARTGNVHVIRDLTVETRWGEFVSLALSENVRSSISLGMRISPGVLASLNIYLTAGAATFDEADVGAITAFTLDAGTVVARAQQVR